MQLIRITKVTVAFMKRIRSLCIIEIWNMIDERKMDSRNKVSYVLQRTLQKKSKCTRMIKLQYEKLKNSVIA